MKPRFANIGNPALRQLYLGDTEPYTPPAEELVIPLNERKSIQTLTEVSCRWPIGDPQLADFHFCGRNKITGLPYCDFHARRAFQPPQPRRRDREVYAPGVIGAPPVAQTGAPTGGGPAASRGRPPFELRCALSTGALARQRRPRLPRGGLGLLFSGSAIDTARRSLIRRGHDLSDRHATPYASPATAAG
jgi:hypothetical protein